MGHNANDSQNDLQKKYKEVCADLNLDKAAADEAWQSFQRIGNNYSLEVSYNNLYFYYYYIIINLYYILLTG